MDQPIECFSCSQAAQLDQLPPRENIWTDGLWRVAHAFNSALPGWLVLLPLRHIESLADLTPAEAIALGPLLQRTSEALSEVAGCEKTYVILFAEAPGFHHLHFHIVPRMPELPREYKGGRIFSFLDRPQDEWVPSDEMDRIGLAVRERLQATGGNQAML